MFIPVVLILIQVETRFGFQPLRQGESVLIKTFWKAESFNNALPNPIIFVSKGIRLTSPALRIRETHEIDWKIEAVKYGTAFLSLQTQGEEVTIPVLVSDRLIPVSPWNGKKNSLKMLLYPASHPLPSHGNLISVDIAYPNRSLPLWGYSVYWIWPFLGLTLIAGYLMKGIFRVQF